MAFITVPDQILEKNTCSECFRYLSVMPVKVYPNGATKCGRCSNDGDGGTKSMYETILKNALFPCINRYDGCNKLMESELIEDHEKTCLGDKSGSNHCPLCEFEHVTSYFIYRHILANHKDNVLDTNEVHLDFGCDLIKTFLYYENYLLFAISISRFSFEDKYIELGVTHFSPKYSKIAYKFQLFATGEDAAIVRGTSVYKTHNEETKIIALLKNVSSITMKLNFSIPQNMPEYLIGKLICKKNNVDTQTIEPPKIRNGDISANMYGVMFEYEIKNIHEFLSKEKDILFSPIYFMNETPIQLQVEIEPKVEDSFRVFLWIDRNKTLIKPWSRYAEVELTLVSTKLDITVKISKEFSSERNWECVTFNKTFYEILDPKNGIIKDNSICIKFLGMITSV